MKLFTQRISVSFIKFSALLLTISRLAGADPIIVPLPGGGGGEGPIIMPVERTVRHCASEHYQYEECRVRGRIIHVELVRQYSHAACIRGRSYGYFGNTVWVDRGCRANFAILHLSRHHFSDFHDEAEELEEQD